MPNPIIIKESENPPRLTEIREEDGFLLRRDLTDDFRIREVVYLRLQAAQRALPPGHKILIYEAFRSRAKQWELWNAIHKRMCAEFPEESVFEIDERCREFVADPRGSGSGHQAGGAVDATLVGIDGQELDMGTAVDEISEKTRTKAPGLTWIQRQNRALLLRVMETGGLVNYPSEWWHFSYGDRLWAEITLSTIAIFGPID